MQHFSIVIPVFRSTKSLEVIVKQIDGLQSQSDLRFEVILVNDSPDFSDTVVTLEKIRKGFDNVKVITLRKNQGQHIALLVGINNAIGDYIITMDDDLQHPVSEIPRLISSIIENKNVEAVFAVPSYRNKKHKIWRNLGSFILNKVDTLFLKKPKNLIKSSFRIFTRDIAKAVVANYNAMPSLSSLIINTTNNIINIQVEHNSRYFGKSNYTLSKLISLTFNNIIHYSSLPLKLVGFIGIIGFVFSVIFSLTVIARKIFGGVDFPGYTSTIALINFFGGLILFSIGLIGEYLIRIIKEQQKPDLDILVK